MKPRAVFCDRLTWRSAIALVAAGPATVRILDDIPETFWSTALRKLLALFRRDIVPTQFFAGHLRGAGGESLYVLASRRSSVAALEAARAAVASDPQLAAINERSGCDRLILRIARQLWLGLGRQVLQIYIAEALADSRDTLLLLARPTRYDPGVLQGVSSRIEVRHYRGESALIERARLLGWVLTMEARAWYWRTRSMGSRAPAHLRDPAGRPGVLLIQEDEVSSDHSFRTQPHWFPAAPTRRLPFATYLLEGGASPKPSPATTPADLTVLNERALVCMQRWAGPDDFAAGLRSDARRCLSGVIGAKHDWLRTAFAVSARLLLRAGVLASACRFLNVRTFLTGEPYLFDADAMHVVSRDVELTTVAFQYSNLAYGNVITASTSDYMLLFSDRYQDTWTHCGIRPRHFSSIGYPFDVAFDRVRPRAAELRRRLQNAGARFILCYFDENVGPPKYGFIAPSDLDAEIRMLAQLVLDDPQVAVIFKSQFRKRSPTVRLPGDALLRAALATGRMVDLYAGAHRNIVLPAEAALASDLAISHVIGGTAALECALAGTRCILINFNGLKTANDDLYARGLVVFTSFAEALHAVALFRRGDADQASLGDWSAFLHELEPYRDGRAADRLREVLEALVCERRLPDAFSLPGQERHG